MPLLENTVAQLGFLMRRSATTMAALEGNEEL
jgi:hypothetical protein